MSTGDLQEQLDTARTVLKAIRREIQNYEEDADYWRRHIESIKRDAYIRRIELK